MPESLKRATVRLVLLLAALLGAYFPAIHAYYLHTEDYGFFYWGGFPFSAMLRFLGVAGRPLDLLFFRTYSLVHTIYGMNFLRAVTVLYLAGIGILVYRCLTAFLSRDRQGAVVLAASIAMLTTPAYVTSVGFLTTAPLTFAVLVAAAAFLASLEGRRIVAFLLLLAALALYQPGALFYVSLAAVSTFLCDPLTFWRDHVRKLALQAGVLAAACAVYYFAWRIWLQLAGAPMGTKYEARRFVGDVPERLRWFIRAPLFEASNLWFVQPKLVYAVITGAVILTALILEAFPGGRRRTLGVLGKILAIVLMIPLTYGISLASYMPSTEYRTYTALGGAIALLFVLSIARLMPRRAAPIAAAAVALCGICAANVIIRRYYTEPDAIEFRYVKDQIADYRKQHGDDFSMIDIIVNPKSVAAVQRNEMGEPTLRHGPNLQSIARAALDELGITREVPVYQVLPDRRSLWVLWGKELHWLSLDYTYGPPPAGKAITIDATQIKQLR